jgi:hypothetical protein
VSALDTSLTLMVLDLAMAKPHMQWRRHRFADAL